MKLLKIAWRNIWRNKLRSLVVIISMTLGIMAGIFAVAWINGLMEKRVEDIFSLYTSHIQIHTKKYYDNFSIKETIKVDDNHLKKLYDIDSITKISRKLKVSAMVNTASKNLGVTIFGINPEEEKLTNDIYNRVDTTGKSGYFKTKSKRAVLISEKMAEEMKLKVGSKLVITFQSYSGEITGGLLKICGIFKTNNSTWDKTHIFMRDSYLREIAEIPENNYHEISIITKDHNNLNSIKNKITQIDDNYLVEDWAILEPYTKVVLGLMDLMMIMIVGIILLALSFGILNTMLMAIMERTRELGMLMAIGMSKGKIFKMIMFETIILSLIGAIVGEILIFGIVEKLSVIGIQLPSSAGLEAYGYPSLAYPSAEINEYLTVTIMVIFAGILSSIYPAIKALKLKPVEAIRTL